MIVVFGKSGQVATELRRQADVTALGREDADLADPDACASVIRTLRPAAVINAAAWTAVDAAEDNEGDAHKVNCEAPGAMATACAALSIPFLHISTDYVFNGSGERPWRETDPVAPLNAYGRTKLAGERAIMRAGGNWAILRTSWVFSAQGSNFVKTMLRLSQTHDRLSVVADQVGGPTPAADIATALLVMGPAMIKGQSGGIYHFGGAPAVSWADFARAIFEAADRAVSVDNIATADWATSAVRPLNSRLDCAKLTADFGIKPADWKAGLASILNELGGT